MSNATLRPTMLRPNTLRPNRLTSLRLPAALLACAFALLVLPAGAGELYQWTDANGVTHYSDSPPSGQRYQSRVISDSGASVPTETDEPAVAAQCTTARANLALLQKDAPVGIDADQDGKPDTEFNAEQRAAQTALAQAAIGVHCAEAGEATAATQPAA